MLTAKNRAYLDAKLLLSYISAKLRGSPPTGIAHHRCIWNA